MALTFTILRIVRLLLFIAGGILALGSILTAK
jgi:hypothetical protein